MIISKSGNTTSQIYYLLTKTTVRTYVTAPRKRKWWMLNETNGKDDSIIKVAKKWDHLEPIPLNKMSEMSERAGKTVCGEISGKKVKEKETWW